MNRNSSPGLGQWLVVSLMVASALFLFYKLYEYSTSRVNYPAGLTIGGIDVGLMNPEQASEVLNNQFIESPVILYHLQEELTVRPTDAEFELDMERMLTEADYQRTQLDFWAGFWGHLWGRPFQVESIPLYATHNPQALINELNRLSVLLNEPAQPPQPVPGTLSFQRGTTGTRISIDRSLDDVSAALYRPFNREVRLEVETVEPERPDIGLLARLLVNYLQDFELADGVPSIFILDTITGKEVSINADVAMSGMSLMKLPIMVEFYRAQPFPTQTHLQLLSDMLVIQSDNESANQLLSVIAGEDDPYRGASMVTNTMQELGLQNTFMLTPYDGQPLAGQRTPTTPANSVDSLRTAPDPLMQTTSEDLGTLLSMIYFCAEGMGGALTAVYPEQITQAECQQMVNVMAQNKIGSLIEEGVPPETQVAHRHGWIRDTHGDAGIVYSEGGDYIIVQILYQFDLLEWPVSAPLLAEISRATYNYFNFDQPYLNDSQLN